MVDERRQQLRLEGSIPDVDLGNDCHIDRVW